MAKMGRPTENPKPFRRSFRLSENDIRKLDFCVEKGYSMTDVVRYGIDRAFNEVFDGKSNALEMFIDTYDKNTDTAQERLKTYKDAINKKRQK